MKILVLLVAFLSLVLAGCGGDAEAKVPTEPMGPNAPEYGSTAELSTVAGFLTGRWCPIESNGVNIDPEFAKQLGLDSLNDPNEVEVLVDLYWEFAPDGTFFYSEKKANFKIQGRWTAGGNGVRLTYEMMNDKPLAEAKANIQKGAETGQTGGIAAELKMSQVFESLEGMTYLEIHEDKKRLHFKPEGLAPGSLQALAASQTTLMRMGF